MTVTGHKLLRRILSPRGSVFIEFASVIPVLIMIGIFPIEMMQFHDAQLMADHTAWRLARIAAVRTNLDGKVKMPEKNLKIMTYSSAETVTAFFMSTATPGWMVGSDKALAGQVKELIKNKIKSKKAGSIVGGIAGSLIENIGIMKTVENGFQKLVSGSTSSSRNMLRMAMAFERLKLAKDVVQIKSDKIGELEYPLISKEKNKVGQTPDKTDAYLVSASINYPLRSGWIFKHVLPGENKDSTLIAHGRAMMLAERRGDPDLYYVDPEKSPTGSIDTLWTMLRNMCRSFWSGWSG